jgi:hypothetical protein
MPPQKQILIVWSTVSRKIPSVFIMQFNWQQAILGLSTFCLLGLGGYTLIPKGSEPVISQPGYKDLRLLFINREKQTEVIEGVKVRISSAGPNKSDLTNTDGQITFKIKTKSKKVEVLYEKKGFKSGRIEIDIDSEQDQTSNIPVEPDVSIEAEKKTLK